MDKKKFIIIIVLSFIVIFSLIFFSIKLFENNKLKVAEKRYDEIRESAKKAMEWKLRANYPRCPIGDKYKKRKNSYSNSKYLIDQGYIKKEELLDIDGVNYCDMYVVEYRYIDESISLESYKNDCEVDYKVYIKCNDYEDKGYIDWGD